MHLLGTMAIKEVLVNNSFYDFTIKLIKDVNKVKIVVLFFYLDMVVK